MPDLDTGLGLSSESALDIDFDTLGAYERYKLMAGLIVPRPIALVTTLSSDGVVNAAPFSMFCMVGEDPPVVMISVTKLDGVAQKDTAVNIDAGSEFVVHIPDERMAMRMHRCGTRFPPDVDAGPFVRAVFYTSIESLNFASTLVIKFTGSVSGSPGNNEFVQEQMRCVFYPAP